MLTKDYYNDFFEIGQLKINFSLFELGLPDDDPVYTLKKVMEDLDFSGLLACYSDKGKCGIKNRDLILDVLAQLCESGVIKYSEIEDDVWAYKKMAAFA